MPEAQSDDRRPYTDGSPLPPSDGPDGFEARRFRKRAVEVDAVQWNGRIDPARQIIGWIAMNNGSAAFVGPQQDHRLRRADEDRKPAFLVIDTLEGAHRADIGDWIVRGIAGEFYPVKPHIFDKTYEAAVTTSEVPRPTVTDVVERGVRAAAAKIGADNLSQRRLAMARRALINTGYFTEDEVGDDIAPRIIELVSNLRGRVDELQDRLDQMTAIAAVPIDIAVRSAIGTLGMGALGLRGDSLEALVDECSEILTPVYPDVLMRFSRGTGGVVSPASI